MWWERGRARCQSPTTLREQYSHSRNGRVKARLDELANLVLHGAGKEGLFLSFGNPALKERGDMSVSESRWHASGAS